VRVTLAISSPALKIVIQSLRKCLCNFIRLADKFGSLGELTLIWLHQIEVRGILRGVPGVHAAPVVLNLSHHVFAARRVAIKSA
jgi:hypothetical protein